MTAARAARRGPIVFVALAGCCAAAGCGLTHLQTARTTARGQTQTTIGASLIHTSDRGTELQGLPLVTPEIMVRHGASDRVDWGVRTFVGLGLLADLKWSLLSPERRTALAVSAGFGAAADPPRTILHVPLTVTASHTLLPWLTPYAAMSYGAFWIFGYGDRDPGVQYAARTGTGDGVVTVHVGLELATRSRRGVFFEYSYARPVVDDPGDFYQFATNQFFSIAFRSGNSTEPTLSR